MPLNLLTLTYILNLTTLKGLMSGTKLHIHFSRTHMCESAYHYEKFVFLVT